MVLGFGTLLNGILSSRAASRKLVASPDINLRLAGAGAVPGHLAQLAVTSPSGTNGLWPSPVISAFSGEDQYPLFLLKPVGVPNGIEGYRCSYNIADPSNFSYEVNSDATFSQIDLPTGGVAGGPAKRYTFTVNTSGFVRLHFNLDSLFRSRPNMFRTQVSCWLRFVSGNSNCLNLRPHGWTSYQILMTSEWNLYRVSRGDSSSYGYSGHGGWNNTAFELILGAPNSTITFDLDISPEYGPIAEFIPLSREVGSPVRAYSSTPTGVLSEEGVTEAHLGNGFKIATSDLRGIVDRVNLDFTYTDQPLILNTKFHGAVPARTAKPAAVYPIPPGDSTLETSYVPSIFPNPALRAKMLINGNVFFARGYATNNGVRRLAVRAVVEHVDGDGMALNVYNVTTSSEASAIALYMPSGTVARQIGNAGYTHLGTGPNGGAIYELWCEHDGDTTAYSFTALLYAATTGSGALDKTAIIHNFEVYDDNLPLPLERIVLTNTDITRLAEVISTPTWTPDANLSVVLDLAVDALPSSDTVLLSRSGVALSLLADGRVRVTDGTTTVTSTAAVTAGGVRRIGFAAGTLGTLLRIGNTIEAHTAALNFSAIDRLDFGYAPWGSFDRVRIWRRQLSLQELASA